MREIGSSLFYTTDVKLKINSVLTLTKRVLGANIEWASTPLRYAFTSGIPEPAAAGAM